MTFLDVKNVNKNYETKKVLKEIDFKINEGELVCLLGPSGSGKTTLLRTIAGLESIDSGQIFLNSRNVTYMSPKERKVSMIFQQYTLFPTMTVFDNIAFGLKLQKKDKDDIYNLVQESLKSVNMLEHANKFPSQLSGGEQQRVALARAIVTESKLLLMDEPFSAIDAKLRKSLQLKIKEIQNALNLTTIFVTHDQEEAMKISDRIYIMDQGRVVQHGTPEEIYLNPVNEFVASFIGNYNIYQSQGRIKAFRAEVMNISGKPYKNITEEMLVSEGILIESIIQGNTVRYIVEVGEQIFYIDNLFLKAPTLNVGDTVYLMINKENILDFGLSED